jgi:hypothetical protein
MICFLTAGKRYATVSWLSATRSSDDKVACLRGKFDKLPRQASSLWTQPPSRSVFWNKIELSIELSTTREAARHTSWLPVHFTIPRLFLSLPLLVFICEHSWDPCGTNACISVWELNYGIPQTRGKNVRSPFSWTWTDPWSCSLSVIRVASWPRLYS